MPRISKRTARHHTALGSGHIFQLLTGHDYFGDGFGRDTKAAMPAMRAAWADPEVRQRVYDLMQERLASGRTQTVPWAEVQFGR